MPFSGRKSRNCARVRKSAQSTAAPGSFRQKYQWPEDASFTLESSPATQRVSNWFSRSARTLRFSSLTVITAGGSRGEGRMKPEIRVEVAEIGRRTSRGTDVGDTEKTRRTGGK